MNNEEKILKILEKHSEMFEQLHQGQTRIENRLEVVENRLEAVENRLEAVETEIKTIKIRVENLESEIQYIKEDVQSIRDSVIVIENKHGERLGILLDRDKANLNFIGRCDSDIKKLERGFERLDAEVAGLKMARA